jgi:hypothetical protein
VDHSDRKRVMARWRRGAAPTKAEPVVSQREFKIAASKCEADPASHYLLITLKVLPDHLLGSVAGHRRVRELQVHRPGLRSDKEAPDRIPSRRIIGSESGNGE